MQSLPKEIEDQTSTVMGRIEIDSHYLQLMDIKHSGFDLYLNSNKFTIFSNSKLIKIGTESPLCLSFLQSLDCEEKSKKRKTSSRNCT